MGNELKVQKSDTEEGGSAETNVRLRIVLPFGNHNVHDAETISFPTSTTIFDLKKWISLRKPQSLKTPAPWAAGKLKLIWPGLRPRQLLGSRGWDHQRFNNIGVGNDRRTLEDYGINDPNEIYTIYLIISHRPYIYGQYRGGSTRRRKRKRRRKTKKKGRRRRRRKPNRRRR